MAWIESHQSLRDHPKTRKLSRILGASLPATIGHLQCLWWWAIDYAEDGNLSRFDAFDIAIGGEWDQDAEAFVDALVTVGFLEYTSDGLTVHDWDDYAGKLIERRKANAERMRKARAERDAGTSEPRAAHVQRTTDARAERPNRTNQTKPTEPTKPTAPKRASPPASAKRPTRIPSDFTVTDEMRGWADDEGMPEAYVRSETAKFVDHYQAAPNSKGVKVDWAATWRNWLRRDLDGARASPKSNITHLQAGGRTTPNGYRRDPGPKGWSADELAEQAIEYERRGT